MTTLDVQAGQVAHPPGEAEALLREASMLAPPALELARERSIRGKRSALPALLVADVSAIAVALLIGQVVDQLGLGRGALTSGVSALVYTPLFSLIFAGYGLYRRGRRRLVASTFPDLSQLIHALILGCLLLLLISNRANAWIGLTRVDRVAATLTGLVALVTVPAARMVTRSILRGSNGRRSRVLIVGSGLVAASVALRVSAAPGLVVVGCVDDNEAPTVHPAGDIKLLGGLDDLVEVIERHDVDHIVVAFSPVVESRLAALLRSLADQVQISVVPRMFDLLAVRSKFDDLAGLPVVDVAPAALGPADRFAKRALDIAVSAVSLLVLSPALLAIALWIKATSAGPVLFHQQRTGRKGRAFAICKFRTMRQGAEAERADLSGRNEVDGPLFKIKVDPRVTRIGSVLRLTSLDELPQMWNVFRGDMSLVGPRPFVVSESAGIDGWAARRFDVRPGMTGLWQVSGRNDLPFEELRRLDYSYVASWSLWWDLRILWHTPAIVFARRGAY